MDFIHEYFSPATPPALLENVPGELPAQAHADWHLLSGVYRQLLRETIDDPLNGIGDDHEIARFILLRLFARVGRAAILCDIALRSLGHGPEVDALVAKIRQLVNDPEVQRGATTLRRVLNEVTEVPMTEGPDAVRRRMDMLHAIATEHPEIGVVIEKIDDTVGSLRDLVPESFKGELTSP